MLIIIGDYCVNMLDADLIWQQKIKNVPFYTDSGENCQLSATWKSVQYNDCIIFNNADNYPQCLTQTKWATILLTD